MWGIPITLLWRFAGALALTGLVAFGVHKYNVSVSAKHVAAALVKERAETAPRIKLLQDGLAKERATIASLNQTALDEKTKQLKVANENTIQYNAVVKKYTEVFAKYNAAFLAKSDLADRLRNITEQSSSGSTNTSDSGFTKRLGTAYAQCESDVGGLLETASRANERAAKAEAGLRALKQ